MMRTASRRTLIAGLWLIFTAGCARADSYVRQPSIDAVHYDISLELTDASDEITAIAKVYIRIREEGTPGMWLDFGNMAIDGVRVGGIERAFTRRDGRLTFDFGRPYSENEIAVVEVSYHGRPRNGLRTGKNRHGRRVTFSHNWPDNARHWFPSIDHPSDKATVNFTVTAPEKYEVVANGRMSKTVLLPDGRKLTRWTESKPIPTYSMAVGVAEFSIIRHEGIAGLPMAWYVYPQDSEVAPRKFDRTALMLACFGAMIGPYPYEKLAQVQSAIGMAAMENSSTIFYGESAFLGEPVPEQPVAHEIAHQWFGNSVTQEDWDHLWLSEGFATYFEALFYEHLDGPEALQRIMAGHAKRIRKYKPALSRPIIDPAQADPVQKLTPVNYEKGAWVLHMLRGLLGDRTFFEGIRRYYALHEGRNASSDDFRKVMESVSGIDLAAFFRQWLYQAGWPEYAVGWRWDESAGELEISILQNRSAGLFDMPLNVVITAGNRKATHRIRINEAAHTFRIPLRTGPLAVEIDPGGWVLKSVVTADQFRWKSGGEIR